MLLTQEDRGVFPVAITPFDEYEAIDYASVDRLIDFYMKCAVPGITLLGILGEPQKLTDQEQLELVQHVLRRVMGRMKVIVGAKHASAITLKTFAAQVMDMGASGLMISPAGTIRQEEQLHSFFGQVARTIGPEVPIVLQDLPRQTGVTISASSMIQLIAQVPSITVIKHEEDGGLRKISRLRAAEASGGRRVAIWAGNSGIHLPQELARGADGANTGIGFPEILIETCVRFSSGQPDAGEDIYDAVLPLLRHENQPGSGLAIRKEILRRRGIIACARLRTPAPGLDQQDHDELSALVGRLKRRLEILGVSPDLLKAPWA